MWFWRRWREQTRQYQEWERLHENNYVLQHGSFGNAQYYYDVYRPIGDGDLDFPNMAISIIQEVLCPFKVVTYVKTWNIGMLKKQKTPNPQDYFPARYYNDLKTCDNTRNAFYNQDMELITLSDGIDLPLMSALLDRGKREIWSNNIGLFAYHSYPFSSISFDTIKAVLNQNSCDRYVVYEEQHDVLRIIVNYESPMAEESIVTLVQNICNRYNKSLEVIPTLI